MRDPSATPNGRDRPTDRSTMHSRQSWCSPTWSGSPAADSRGLLASASCSSPIPALVEGAGAAASCCCLVEVEEANPSPVTAAAPAPGAAATSAAASAWSSWPTRGDTVAGPFWAASPPTGPTVPPPPPPVAALPWRPPPPTVKTSASTPATSAAASSPPMAKRRARRTPGAVEGDRRRDSPVLPAAMAGLRAGCWVNKCPRAASIDEPPAVPVCGACAVGCQMHVCVRSING